MVGRYKKPSGFISASKDGSKKFIYDETENKDFTLQNSNTILNTSMIVIPFHPIDSDFK